MPFYFCFFFESSEKQQKNLVVLPYFLFLFLLILYYENHKKIFPCLFAPFFGSFYLFFEFFLFACYMMLCFLCYSWFRKRKCQNVLVVWASQWCLAGLFGLRANFRKNVSGRECSRRRTLTWIWLMAIRGKHIEFTIAIERSGLFTHFQRSYTYTRFSSLALQIMIVLRKCEQSYERKSK